ncbi:MAG: UDP-N-acetylmuramoyl-tripeptide--D-alanyl-D-alanine ligase [Planctomycetota bacterium]
MLPLSIHEIIKATKGVLLTTAEYDHLVKNISTDTRKLKPDSFFFALRGKNFDGHNFIKTAVAKGVAGVVISRRDLKITDALKKIPVIRVTNTTAALGQLASYYRDQLAALIIAVTGSNGKTTTKNMLAYILSQNKSVIQSQKSFNNLIGVSLTLLEADSTTEYIILELGSNHPGEIAQLAKISRPHIGIITNISATHLEGLKNEEGVAREKKTLLEHMDYPAIAIWEAGNHWFNKTKLFNLKRRSKYAEPTVVTFGIKKGELAGSDLKIKPNGLEFLVNEKHHCFLPVLGQWNMKNSLAALAASSALGFSLNESLLRLKNFRLPPMRMEPSVIKGTTIINDAYNANPASVSLAAEELKLMAARGRKIFVLGDMLELGKSSNELHLKTVQRIMESGINALLCVGKEVKNAFTRLSSQKNTRTQMFHFDSAKDAGNFLAGYLKSKDVVLLKGSRGIGLETIIPYLKRKKK